jgi:endogenous inhibitor of DNA gyrase (YacG/DUF329 family)
LALVRPHVECHAPGVPCPVCNAGDAPRDPPGFVPFSTPRAAAIHWAEGERRVIEGADS